MLVSGTAAQAAIFNVGSGDVAGLKSAIATANSNGQDDTIELFAGSVYILTARDSLLNGLPLLGADGGHKLVIHGNGATIQRVPAIDDSAHHFRIFQTSSGANVTLTGLTQRTEIFRAGLLLTEGQFITTPTRRVMQP